MDIHDDEIANPAPPGGEPEAAPILLPAVALPPPAAADPAIPEDLRISWSWTHFILFILFAVSSMILVSNVLFIYFQMRGHLSVEEAQRVFPTQAPFPVVVEIVWFALLMLFLYVTLAVLREAPFWRTVGWRRVDSAEPSGRFRGWRYFFLGCGLFLFVAVAVSRVQPTGKIPIQELFKDRESTILLMMMAVLVAPLVEETVFRGYLYPFFARQFGVWAGILLTGTLFGLMHGSQLGWTAGLVAVMILVGLVLTYVRARSGTVLASYLVHLGYNSTIAFTSFVLPHLLPHH